jgi:pimeloyl-ACP methyl ester carboxylesterase
VTPRLNHVRNTSIGQPVFFQHGLCGSAAQTQEACPEDPRFQLNTIECRGHGASETGPYTEFSIQTFANDVAAHILAPTIVGGISMGAAIALHLSVHKPQLVKALVLARPAWLAEKAPVNMKPNAVVGHLLAQFPPEEAKAKFLDSALAKELAKTAPDNLASLVGFFSREPIATTAELLTRISDDGPGVTETQVRNIKVPTLIIATEQDSVHPVAHAAALHALIPQSRFVTITPKGVDKARYIREFQSTLLKFFEENA